MSDTGVPVTTKLSKMAELIQDAVLGNDEIQSLATEITNEMMGRPVIQPADLPPGAEDHSWFDMNALIFCRAVVKFADTISLD